MEGALTNLTSTDRHSRLEKKNLQIKENRTIKSSTENLCMNQMFSSIIDYFLEQLFHLEMVLRKSS